MRRTVRLVFLGDISAEAGRLPPLFDERLVAIMTSADLVVGNCESPVVTTLPSLAARRFGQSHAMTVTYLSGLLDAMGARRDRIVLSLANNHALDLGPDGFDETLGHLDGLGVRTIGAHRDGMTRVVDVDALRLGLRAFTIWRNRSAADFAGRVIMRDEALAEPSSAASDHDLLCVFPHWDWEFRHFPRSETRAMAHRLAASGAGLIVGNHAHVIQPIERIDRALVAYGLGDFTGTAAPRVRWPLTIGALLAVDVSVDDMRRGEITRYEAVPFVRRRAGQRETISMLPVAGSDRLTDRANLVLPSVG